MQRYLEPELLDHLDPADPEAVRSRAELRMINGIMGNHRWLQRQLRRHLVGRPVILELGAGDGAFSRGLVASGLVQADQVAALDLMPPPPDWPEGARWVQGSVLDKDSWPQADIIIANLFLHHFDEAQLRQIGAAMLRARVVIACEPARRSLHLVQGALLAALTDLGHVTRNDMLTSIRAGFLGDELPRALNLAHWRCEVAATWLGGYHMIATLPACAR